MKTKMGYVIVSNRVMVDGQRVHYLYREIADKKDDSGWRIFSGDESQEYVDDPKNMAMYNAATILEKEPRLAEVLAEDAPIAFEFDDEADEFIFIERDS
jgi:hypothetical protein